MDQNGVGMAEAIILLTILTLFYLADVKASADLILPSDLQGSNFPGLHSFQGVVRGKETLMPQPFFGLNGEKQTLEFRTFRVSHEATDNVLHFLD